MRLGSHGGIDAAALHIGQQTQLSGDAPELFIQRLLDARISTLLEIHRAEHVREQLILRVATLAVALVANPFEAQTAQPLSFFARDAALDDEVAAALAVRLVDGLK